MKMLLNISIIAILLSKVMPCDCAPPPSPEEAYEMADAVFSGEVISIVEDWDYFFGRCETSVIHSD